MACSNGSEAQIDAIFYPDRNDLTTYEVLEDIGSLEACREWAFEQAALRRDTGMRRGDYQCGVDPLRIEDDKTVYREMSR